MKESEGKEAFRKPILILGLAFVALGCTLGFSSLAWFATPATSADVSGLTGEATGSYFSPVDGQTIADGSKEHPFGIQNAQQLYYFAWLQDMGYFNKDVKGKTDDSGNDIGDGVVDTQYYFELMNDIDATGKILPPCGIEKYPFVGNFDAKNYTISNLTISNALSTSEGDGYIEKYPLSTTSSLTIEEFGNQAGIVGFFGIIGDWDGKSSSYAALEYDSTINEVKNLYLDNITIKTKKDNLLVGIFAGYANGTIDNCGVHYAKFDINGATKKIDGFSKVSEYSLIGSYNKEKFSWETTSGGSSGDDIGYGTSTNIAALHKSLIQNGLNEGSTGKISSKTALPFRYENTTLIQGSGESKTVTTVKGGGVTTKTITVNPSEYSTYKASTKGNNLGYYSGTIETFEQNLDYNVNEFTTSTAYGYAFKTPPDNILTYLQTKGTHLLRFVSGSSGHVILGDFNYVENAQVGDWTGNLVIPANGVWVAPKENGTFRFAFYNPGYSEGKSVGIAYTLIERTTVGDYSTPLSGYTYTSTIQYSGKYGYFEATASTYYEYFISFNTQGSYSPYIAYMDIGTDSGSGDSGDSGETTTTRTLDTTFDWVTKENNVLTKIKNADGSEITGNTYTKSEVFFEIDETDISRTFSWRRTTLDNETLVLYYEQYTSTTATTVISAIGSGKSNKAKDGNCEAKAEEATT